jgi:acyl-CoA hydrolase
MTDIPIETSLDTLDFASIVRPGDHVLWTQGAGEPVPLVERLLEQRHQIGHFSVLLGASYTDLVRPEHADCIAFTTMGAVGTTRRMVAAGAADVMPCHLSEAARMLRSGQWRTDVVIVQVAQHPQTGRLSYSSVNGYISAALAQARVVVAEVNQDAPWTTSRTPLHATEIDVVVRTARPLVETSTGASTQVDEQIAEHVVDLVSDGSTIQLGIGGVPRAVATRLTEHRRLSMHTGVMGDAVIDLIESGALTNESKTRDRGLTVTGGLVGTRRLFEYCHLNSAVAVEPVEYTHAHEVLSSLPYFTAINSALEVDLTGQVGSEVAGRAYVGTVGGQADFVRGAVSSSGGKSIIALASTTSRGTPRIVPVLKSGVVTISRADADVVVTEWGRAELRGRSLEQRMLAMIRIAHPDARDELRRRASELVPALVRGD